MDHSNEVYQHRVIVTWKNTAEKKRACRNTAKKMKFSFKDFLSKCSFLQIWSHLLKKSLCEKTLLHFLCSEVNLLSSPAFPSNPGPNPLVRDVHAKVMHT